MKTIKIYKTVIDWTDWDLDNDYESAITVQIDNVDEILFSLESNNEYSPEKVCYTKEDDFRLELSTKDTEQALEAICDNPKNFI